MSGDVAVAYQGRRPASREDRATIAFVVVSIFVAAIWLLVAVGAPAAPTITYVLTMASGPLTIAVFLVAALAVSQRRPWAVAVMTPLLTLMVVVGVVSFLVALLQMSIQIPLGALLGWWALRARPEARPEPARAGLAGASLFVAALLVTAWPLLSLAMLRPGGPFIVGAHELYPVLSVTCQPSYPDRPETIDVLYHWSWNRAEPLETGTDQVAITWVGQDESGFTTWFPEGTGTQPAGITEANQLIGDEPGVVFAIDLAIRRFEPGDLHFTVHRGSAGAPGHGIVEFRARYTHAPTDIYQPNSTGLWYADDVDRCTW